MNTGIVLKISKKCVRRCSDGSDRTREKTMITFREWLAKPIKSKRKKKDVDRINHQGSSQIGHEHQQGKTAGYDQKIEPADVYYLPEP